MAKVKILLVTFRRPHLLRRALESLRSQSLNDWSCFVLNDDPSDVRPIEVVKECGDSRIRMFEPQIRRGPARAFNEAFCLRGCEYCSLLEDDNWWEPQFLEVMTAELEKRPSVALACSNECVWKEEDDGSWSDTSRTVWSDFATRTYSTSVREACGSAKICNSSMLWRQALGGRFLTPDDIPVDVTEHFRERTIPQPILLVGRPLANFAITQHTNRDRGGVRWGDYQVLLIGSCFASLKKTERLDLAKELFRSERGLSSPRVTSYLSTALAVPEARTLFAQANAFQLCKFLASLVLRPYVLPRLLSIRGRYQQHWRFLVDSPLNRKFADGVSSISP